MCIRFLPRPPRAGQPHRRSTDPADRGQATAELAVGLPSLFLVVSLLLWMLGAAAAQARCAEAARIGARLAARGEADATVRAWVVRAAPAGAAVSLRRGADDVEVLVTVRVVGALDRVAPVLAVTGRAVAPAEPGGTAGPFPEPASPTVGS